MQKFKLNFPAGVYNRKEMNENLLDVFVVENNNVKNL